MNVFRTSCIRFVLRELRAREPLFGFWRIGRFIGAGGFACVFTILNQERPGVPPAVLKAIPVTPETIGRYRGKASVSRAVLHAGQEIARLIELAHRSNLVCLHNFQIIRHIGESRDAALLLLMMDYFPHSLSDLVKRAPLPPGQVYGLLLDCLTGLESIHEQGMVHRDIKPANILLDDAGTAYISDFGVAVRLEQSFRIRGRAGTPAYMPPEVYGCSKQDIGEFTGLDLYALGMTCFQALEGALPFERESTTRRQMIERRFRGEELRFSRTVHPALESVLLRMLAHDPRDRYASTTEVRCALAAVGNDLAGNCSSAGVVRSCSALSGGYRDGRPDLGCSR